MNKITFSIGSGLAIAASLWFAHDSSLLSPISLPSQFQSPEIVKAGILVQRNLSPSRQTMTTEQLGTILSDTVDNLEGQAGQWQFEHNGVTMVVVTNDDHDRMRVVAPIAPVSSLTNEQREKMLFANFHTTLDARYAIGTLGGQPAVVSVFVHSLSSLTENDFRSALEQVSQTAQSFGTTYSSGELLLGPGGTNNSGSDLGPERGEEVGI